MSDFDEISRAIGRIEGKLETINATQEVQREKLEKIEDIMTNHRLKVAGLASLISGGVAALYHILKGSH